ncbi:MAG TPA: hypothetical protein VGP85_10760, partial [Pyrinomonadaceae bacterium]|nr:hypothetical protein [Pyrinomonadaceae bacterium]
MPKGFDVVDRYHWYIKLVFQEKIAATFYIHLFKCECVITSGGTNRFNCVVTKMTTRPRVNNHMSFRQLTLTPKGDMRASVWEKFLPANYETR